VRFTGGTLYLTGMLIMGYNTLKTLGGRQVPATAIPVLQAA
jgi:cytochrome c oxidase cbb3-type subunit I